MDIPPHVHPEEETLRLLVRIQVEDCLQVMEPVPHLVVHMSDPQKEFLYLDLALGFYKVDAANLSCNFKKLQITFSKSKCNNSRNQVCIKSSAIIC